MKTITLDFEDYRSELAAAYKKGTQDTSMIEEAHVLLLRAMEVGSQYIRHDVASWLNRYEKRAQENTDPLRREDGKSN